MLRPGSRQSPGPCPRSILQSHIAVLGASGGLGPEGVSGHLRADGDDHIPQLLRACLSHPTHSSCVSIQEKQLPARTELQPPATPCALSLCLRCNPLPPQGLCLQSNAWIFPLQKHCHGKYPAHPSPPWPPEVGPQAWWRDHTSSNNGWHCRQDSRAPILSTWIKHYRGSPSRPAASGLWLSCRNSGSRQLPRDSRVLFLPVQADFLPPSLFYSLKVCSWHSG